MTIGLADIELEHTGTKERVRMPVVGITRLVVSVRWNYSGIYDLTLSTNTLRASSVAARRKHPFCLWVAVDIKAIRNAVKVHLDKQDIKGIVRAETVTHNASMPRYPYGNIKQ